MDELRKLQLLQMATLKEVIRICEKNGIRYYLMFGSLLGTVRHNGFIPWDDDLDVVMERNEYNRFLKHASKELDSKFFLHTKDTDPRYFVSFARIRINDTTFIPRVYKNAGFCHNGIWIDIFPLDYAKSNNSLYERLRYTSMRKILRPMSSFNITGAGHNPRLRRRLLTFLSKQIKLTTILNIIDKVSTSKNTQKGEYYVCFGSPYKMEKSYFPVNYFGEGTKATFETISVVIPDNYDAILRIIYGDYMQLPPENQRVGHLPVLFDCSEVEIPEEQEV